MTADINTPDFWDDAYRDERDGWDMGTPTPVFVDILDRCGMDFRSIGGPDFSTLGRAPRVLIPCSGRGYDALLFAELGWDVTAVDFSAEPLRWLEDERAARDLDIRILEADMFPLGKDYPEHFDLILEYTCVCAIEPVRREEFLRFAAETLRPGGILLALLFPVDGRPGGPPFSIDIDEFKRLAMDSFSLVHESTPATSVKPRMGKERLLVFGKTLRKLRHEEIVRTPMEEISSKKRHPVVIVVDNVRSLYNVGSIFRSCDGALVEKLYLCGFSPYPPRKEISKTALSATESVPWEYVYDVCEAIGRLKAEGWRIAALEHTTDSISCFDLAAEHFPLAIVVGNEVAGVTDEALALCDFAIEIPMYGAKQSLNVAVATGVICFESVRVLQGKS